jgi:hypothetical protein
MNKIGCITGLVVIFLVTSASAQTYDRYFFNKIKADSLIARGDYTSAIPHLRVCISEPDMVTVRDEFNFGYALFKQHKFDTAAMFLNRSLSNGFHFHDVAQIQYWRDAGVFDRLNKHPHTAGIAQMLESNTLAYVNSKVDSILLRKLLTARELDQKFRKPGLDFEQQIPLDVANQALLREIVKVHGWPTNDKVGWHGANAAFLIAQHSDRDTGFQLECREYIRVAYYQQKIDQSFYAYIIDRTRVNATKAQVFGTQYDQPIDAVEYVDLRRKVFGLQTLEEYLHARSVK